MILLLVVQTCNAEFILYKDESNDLDAAGHCLALGGRLPVGMSTWLKYRICTICYS